ncbi:MAG: argC, partial [Deltaproteobacteria bacterium]|nr:argC [Deltaproteobacteria bacterium]
TIYGNLKPGVDMPALLDAYRRFYEGDTFVRIFGPERMLTSTDVRGSNFCNISLNIDERTRKLIVVSVIDNLVKGQAGSAVQNMNIMFGLEETAGLMRPGQYP